MQAPTKYELVINLSALLPDLTVAAAIVPGFTSIGWQALTVRSGRPEPIVRVLGDSLRKVLDDPQLQKRLLETGAQFQPGADGRSACEPRPARATLT